MRDYNDDGYLWTLVPESESGASRSVGSREKEGRNATPAQPAEEKTKSPLVTPHNMVRPTGLEPATPRSESRQQFPIMTEGD